MAKHVELRITQCHNLVSATIESRVIEQMCHPIHCPKPLSHLGHDKRECFCQSDAWRSVFREENCASLAFEQIDEFPHNVLNQFFQVCRCLWDFSEIEQFVGLLFKQKKDCLPKKAVLTSSCLNCACRLYAISISAYLAILSKILLLLFSNIDISKSWAFIKPMPANAR